VALRCTTPRLEAAIGMEPSSAPCPDCGALVFAPGWYCDDCAACAFPTMLLDADFEPNGDDEPDADDEPSGDYDDTEIASGFRYAGSSAIRRVISRS
jgi:hypothetical protein